MAATQERFQLPLISPMTPILIRQPDGKAAPISGFALTVKMSSISAVGMAMQDGGNFQLIPVATCWHIDDPRSKDLNKAKEAGVCIFELAPSVKESIEIKNAFTTLLQKVEKQDQVIAELAAKVTRVKG